MSFDQWNNQADVVDLNKWRAVQQAKAQLAAAQKNQKSKPQQKGNFLTHLLPTIGGTGGGIGGGAAGGAIAGTAIAPGLGTVAGGLVGALIGGFAGGAGGKAVENKLEGKSVGSGVLGQGVEQGVLSAGPLRLLKVGTVGARAGIGALGEEGLSGAINAAAERGSTPILGNTAKNLITQGQQAQGRVAGISAGQKVANHELTPQDTKNMLDVLKSEQIKTGNANNALRDIQDKLNNYGSQISEHFTNNNTPLTKTQVNGIAKDFVSNLNTTDPSVLKQAGILANDLKKNVTDTQSLWQFRKTLDGRIPDSKFMDAATTDKIAALKALRQHITGQLGDIPGATNYHNLSEIKPFISAEAKRLNNPGGGIVGRVAASGPVQKAEQVLGKNTEKVGNALGGIPNANPFGVRGVATRTVPVGLAQALAGVSADNLNNQAQNADLTDLKSVANATPDMLAPDSMTGGASDQTGSPYTRENLMADLQRDPKNADKYLTLFDSLDKIYNPATGASIKPTGQQYGLATGGLNALQQLSDLVNADPSVVARNQTPGQGLPIVGGLVTHAAGTGDYHALADNVLQSLIHLQTGATATPEEVKAAKGQLPLPGDTPEQRKRKIDNLTSMFAPYIQGGQLGSTSTGGSLADALAQLGYQ